MKKPTKFKRQKSEAVEFLSHLPLKHFNRFTKEEILKATGSEALTSKEDLQKLIAYCFDKTVTLKLNFHYHFLNIKLNRDRVKGLTRFVKYNEVWCDVSQNIRKSSLKNKVARAQAHNIAEATLGAYSELEYAVNNAHVKSAKFCNLRSYRGDMIVELSQLVAINNKLCNIFQDDSGIQPTLLEAPAYWLDCTEIALIQNPD